MPIIVEQVTQPNEQDLIDLIKVYTDYPDFASKDKTDIKQWLAEQLAAPNQRLYAARFNDRLLGAACLHGLNTDTAGTPLSIHNFCVRNVTRRRGVGSKLLLDLKTFADTEGFCLTVQVPDMHNSLIGPLEKLGFELGNNRHYNWPAS